MGARYYLDRRPNQHGYDLDCLWRVGDIDLGFLPIASADDYLDLTDFIHCSYDFIAMIHPDITQDRWLRIGEVAEQMDLNPINLDFKYLSR